MDKSYVDKSRLSASWTSLRYVLKSVRLMLLVNHTASFLKTKFVINFLTGTPVQITANGTDLVFLLFAALISTILYGFNVVGSGSLASFVVCPRSILMIKRSPVLLVQSILFFAFYFILQLFFILRARLQ